MIVQLGGVPCIAHPRDLEGLDGVLAELKNAGLAGMDVYYNDYEPDEVERLRQPAERFGLVPWGLTDSPAFARADAARPGGMPRLVRRSTTWFSS